MHTENPNPQQPANFVCEHFETQRMPALVMRFMNALKRTGKSVHTLTAYRNDLGLFTEFLSSSGYNAGENMPDIRDHWIQFLKDKGRQSDASVRRALMSTRTFLHFLVNEKVISGSPLLETKSPQQPTHNLLTILPVQFKKVLKELRREAGSGDEKSARDLVIFEVLGKYGLKASEAANLTWGNISTNGSGGHLLVSGQAERLLAFDRDLEKSLAHLKKVRQELHLSTAQDAKLFFGYLNLSRQTRTASLHRHGIKFVVYEVSARILNMPYNSESLRNFAISQWISSGLRREQIADLAGYSSLNSLERFSLDVRTTRTPKRHLPKTGTPQ